jgi:hypothetical protein
LKLVDRNASRSGRFAPCVGLIFRPASEVTTGVKSVLSGFGAVGPAPDQ